MSTKYRTIPSTHRALLLLFVLAMVQTASADVKLPALLSDHAVLQRDMKVPIWGWAEPGEKVTVTLPNQTHTAEADATGRWQVTLDPLAAGSPFTIVVEGANRIEVKDVEVGEVWLCSGQSNMEWSVSDSRDADLEIPAANHPNIRLITVATEGSQTPLADFTGKWEVCSPKTVAGFSAVGYFFGREISQHEKVPVGLIDNAWGGSACEAWIRRDLMEGNPLYETQLARWDAVVANYDDKKARADFEQRLADWEERAEAARKEGKPEPGGRPWWSDPLKGQLRPSNLYNGRLTPIMPYAIRGVIWYQGETNAGRGYQYREMFPLMIKNWRDDWGQGDFPFYWVQLADFMAEQNQPGDSGWAELREAQTMSLDKLPNTGQAVIIDLGEANDIHPRNKLDVAKRLARIALAQTYEHKIAFDSPRYKSMVNEGEKILIHFSGVNGKLRSVDGKPLKGFAIAGPDRKWVWADAEIVGDVEVAVHSDAIRDPSAVRYAWADNPVANLFDTSGLPVTPFRTDDWPGVTAEAR